MIHFKVLNYKKNLLDTKQIYLLKANETFWQTMQLYNFNEIHEKYWTI